jgi:hypothetical protein
MGVFRPLMKFFSISGGNRYISDYVRKSANVTLTLVAAMAMSARGQQAPATPAPTPTKQQNCTASATPTGGSANAQKPQNCATARGGFGFHGLFHHSGG